MGLRCYWLDEARGRALRDIVVQESIGRREETVDGHLRIDIVLLQ